LAILVASGANVLILDEPTNHLDLESREALEDALLAYEGTLLLVSHDRALLEAVGTRTVAVQDGTLRSYTGGWQEYLRVREERRLAERAPQRRVPAPKPAAKKPAAKKAKVRPPAAAPGCAGERLAAATAAQQSRPNGNGRARSKNARRRIVQLEREIEQAEAALKAVEAELAGAEAWSTPELSAASSERHLAAKRAVEEAFARWEAAAF
jgi:ATP-binding cassette subfamily F protein 3